MAKTVIRRFYESFNQIPLSPVIMLMNRILEHSFIEIYNYFGLKTFW